MPEEMVFGKFSTITGQKRVSRSTMSHALPLTASAAQMRIPSDKLLFPSIPQMNLADAVTLMRKA